MVNVCVALYLLGGLGVTFGILASLRCSFEDRFPSQAAQVGALFGVVTIVVLWPLFFVVALVSGFVVGVLKGMRQSDDDPCE